MKNTAVFLQVRLSSTRLPRKALLPLGGKPLVSHAMESLRQLEAGSFVLLTDDESAPELAGPARDAGFDLFCGPRDDVLRRFALAAAEYRPDTIIRATGDNPLVDAGSVRLLLDLHREAEADYSGFDGPPLGTGVEILSAKALFAADSEATGPYEREHVSPFIYRSPERFRINRITAPPELCLADSPVTVDTPLDFEYVAELYRALYRGRPLELPVIIPWLMEHRRPS